MSGWIIAAAALVLALMVWLQIRTGKLFQYLYFCRFPLLVSAVLVLLPFVAIGTGASSLFKNLFALLPPGIFLATWLALLASWVPMITLEIAVHNAYLRFRVDPIEIPLWVRLLKPLLFALLAVPIIWTLVAQSSASTGQELWAVLQGILAAVACLIAAAVIHVQLLPLGTPGEDLLLPGIARLFRKQRAHMHGRARVPASLSPTPGKASFFDGYIEPDTGYIRPGHLVAFAFFLITLVFYLYHWRGGEPPIPPTLPALGYLLLVLILAGWGLPAAAFFLDRYRVPVLTLLIVGSILVSVAVGTDHYYKIYPAGKAVRETLPSPSPSEVFHKDEEAEAIQHQYPIVIVAASGGGITASLWTAEVLTSLQKAAGPEFSRSIRLISAVSGGSVGTMFYLDRFSDQGYPLPRELPLIVDAARTPSLGAVAWGLAYPDLWRAFPVFSSASIRDRGWAMEQVWRKKMNHGDATLGQWRQKVNRGKLPPMVFNATEVETGNQFLFTPLVVNKTGTWRARFFSDVYQGADIPIVTAARLSATFPWVGPMSRACIKNCGDERIDGVHLADGGYFDNFGVVTVVNWMRSLTGPQRTEMKNHRVLIILIRAFSEAEPDPLGDLQRSRKGKGWIYATAGPILTMYNVRNTAQDDRNATELSLIQDLLESELSDQPGLTRKPEVIPFVLKEKSPLSWKLSEPEANKILCEGLWKSPDNMASLGKVRQAFQSRTPMPGPAPRCR